MNDNRHRRSIRLKEYDYSQAGGYFVTICTHDKTPVFGTLVEGDSILNSHGKIVRNTLLHLPKKYPAVSIDEFIVMPDHLHAILLFSSDDVVAELASPTSTQGSRLTEQGRRNDAPTLGSVIGYFKYHCAKQINLHRNTPGAPVWQRNYYEHVIRNEKDLENIRGYIKYNPQKILY